MKHRLVVSFAFLLPLMYVSMGSMFGLPLPGFLTGHENAVAFGLVQFLLALPVAYVNRKYYQVGFKTLFHASPNMDSLIAIGLYGGVRVRPVRHHAHRPRAGRGAIWRWWSATTWTCTSSRP